MSSADVELIKAIVSSGKRLNLDLDPKIVAFTLGYMNAENGTTSKELLERKKYQDAGQSHVFRFLDVSSPEERKALIDQASKIDVTRVNNIYAATMKARDADKHWIHLYHWIHSHPWIHLNSWVHFYPGI